MTGLPVVYTAKEVAERLAVSEDTIRRKANRGEIRSFRVGSAIRFTEDAVIDYIERMTAA